MTEIYEDWLFNIDTRQILEGYGADKLSAEQQAVCEKLVLSTRVKNPISRSEFKVLIRVVAGGLKNGRDAANLVDALKDIVHSNEYWSSGGMDPHNFLGDCSHPHNLGYIQSLRKTD